jgi:hypothetical protein
MKMRFKVCIPECQGARNSRGNCPHSYGLHHSNTDSKGPFPYCIPITSTINHRNFPKCFNSQSCVICTTSIHFSSFDLTNNIWWSARYEVSRSPSACLVSFLIHLRKIQIYYRTPNHATYRPTVLRTVKNDSCLYFVKCLPYRGASWAKVVMYKFLFNVDEVFSRGKAIWSELYVN